MKARGRPVLGGFTGFLLFLFIALDLFAFGVVASNSPLLTVLPVVGIVVGVLVGMWAPFGSSKPAPVASEMPPPMAPMAPAPAPAQPQPQPQPQPPPPNPPPPPGTSTF